MNLNHLFALTMIVGAVASVGVAITTPHHEGIELSSRPNPVYSFPPSVMRDVPTVDPTTQPTHKITPATSRTVETYTATRSSQSPVDKIESRTLPTRPVSHSIMLARRTEAPRATSRAPVPSVTETHDPKPTTVEPTTQTPTVTESVPPRLKVCEHNKKPKKCKGDNATP